MDKAKIKEALKDLATKLENEDYDDRIAYYTFLLASCKFDNKWYDSLGEELQKKLDGFTPNLVHALVDCLSKFTKEDVKNEEFDLYFFAMDWANEICKAEEIESTKDVEDYIVLCITSVFKMWYNDIKKQDIIDYYRGASDKDFPNMEDVAYNCKWAQETGINCSDISSMFSVGNSGLTDEERKEAEGMIDNMSELFLHVRPLLKESFKDWDDQFVEDHLEDCKTLYLLTNLMFAQIPKGRDASQILDSEEKAEGAFRSYIQMCAGPEYKDKFLGKDFKKYANVFEASYTICLMQDEMKIGAFADSHGSIYEEMTNRRIEELKKKKENGND